MNITLRCEYCTKPFDAPNWKYRERRFCSKSCSVRFVQAERHPPPVVLICERPECGATVELPQWRIDQGARYCSRRCAGIVNSAKRKAVAG